MIGGTYIGGIGVIGVIGAGAKLPDESKTILSLRKVIEPSGAMIVGLTQRLSITGNTGAGG